MKGAVMLFRNFIFFMILFYSSTIFAKDIPIIVISPGKTLQSKSVVGSDVEVIDKKTLQDSNEYFIGDILDKNLNGMNYFQQGGIGTVSGMQLRGQPKRYTTVYIDGVKVSDPSTPSNDYYFNNLISGSFERIEVLKGAQSSLYGSGALAGTIQLFSKKGREGHNNDINLSTGSFNTKKIDLSFDGKDNKYSWQKKHLENQTGSNNSYKPIKIRKDGIKKMVKGTKNS